MSKALIVDDDLVSVECLQKLINWGELGFEEICIASNGKQAFDIAMSKPIDVIISDLKMPFMSGIELVKKLREASVKSEIILLTAYEDFQAARDSVELNVCSYLLKPIDENTLETLSKMLKKIIDKRKISVWNNDFLVGKYDEKILCSFNEDNQLYLKSVLKNIFTSVLDTEEYLLSSMITKILKLLSEFFINNGFDTNTVTNNLQKWENKVKNMQDKKEKHDYLADLFQNVVSIHETEKVDLCEKMKLYIEENYSKSNFSSFDVADNFHYSSSYLNRRFKSVYGITINQYIFRYRMKIAYKLIIETDQSIYEVASQIGFNSSSYFINVFKSYFHTTPRALRSKRRTITDIEDV